MLLKYIGFISGVTQNLKEVVGDSPEDQVFPTISNKHVPCIDLTSAQSVEGKKCFFDLNNNSL